MTSLITVPPTSWVLAIDAATVDRRFGADGVNAALSSARVYVDAPALERGRIVASIVDAPGGRRLTTPFKLAVRLEGEQLDFACACRRGRVCEHVMWLLVDIAFHDELRTAIAREQPSEALVASLPAVRARAIEARTLDERLRSWLPARTFDEDLELDVEVVTIASAAASDGRSAILLRHRRRASRALVPARDVLALRLAPRRRRLVELGAPYHLDRNALVATRGQASILVHLLREEIGLATNGFRSRVRYANEELAPRIDRDGDRLVARWASQGDAIVADAADVFVFAGPFPYVWIAPMATFHPVASSVDLDAAIGMQQVPSLPIDDATAAHIGKTLLLSGRGLGVTLPAPEAFGLPPLEAPSFELCLTGTPLDVRAELFAVYAIGKLRIDGDRQLESGRDLDAEDRALALVREAGMDGDAATLAAAEERAVTFWQNLPELRARAEPRFEVLAAESLSRVKVGPPVMVDVRVSTSAGWLDTNFEFRAGTLGVEIARLHAALASGKRWVVLSDGTLAKIADEVAALVEDAGGISLTQNVGRIAPHQFGRIARWIELADGAGDRVRVALDPAVSAMRERLRELARDPRARLPARLEAELRPYQHAGVAWLQLLRELGVGGLLADDMGLGKTLMTLAFLARWKDDEGPAPSLVVCPTSVVGNWLREAERFTPSLRAIAWVGSDRRTLLGTPQQSPIEADLVVTTYGLLRREAPRLARTPFRSVILDEAQNVKNPASETSRAARGLDARMRLALTGTPVENRLSELWSLMTFANPGMLGTAADFDTRYERPIGQRPDGAVAAELRAVVRPFVLRRTKGEVLTELPPKTEIERSCVFGLRQKRLYDALAVTIRQAVARDTDKRRNARTRLSVLTGILRLRQMACDPRLVPPFGDHEARDPTLVDVESAKRTAFLDVVREIVAADRRALVFSQFVELLGLWRADLDRAGVRYEYLDGATTNRDAVVDRFRRGDSPLFLVSLKAGGAGLNLVEADTVIHCDPWWNPAAEDQATDRAHRIGQSRPVTVVRLVARGTIEDKIALLKEKKRELADAIVGEATGEKLTGLTEDELLALLGDSEGDVDDVD